MKKILSIILALVIIAGTFSFTMATEYTLPSNAEEMNGLLSAVGIIDENFICSERNITRGEFTSLVVKASGLSGYLGDKLSKNSFSDVPSDNPYAPYIAMAKERGYSFGYSDGTFRPDETITYIEALVYIIRLMGYTDVAEERNGFPTGYLTTADSVGITKGISIRMDAPLTAERGVHLIYNALHSKVLTVNTVTPGEASFEINYGSSLMYQSFGIELVEGIMDEVDISALIGSNDLSPYTVSVNGVIIDIGSLSPNYLLGYNVNAYYKYETGKNILVYVSADSSKNSIETVKISDITNIANQAVTYTDKYGKSYNLKYKKGAAILYNGVATKAFFNTSIYLDKTGNKLSGTVDLLDNNGDGLADVVMVNAYEEFLAGKKNTNDKILYDKNNPSNFIELDTLANDPYTIIFDEYGEEIPLTKIKSGMSVIVYRSKEASQGYIKVMVSSKTVSGVLEGKEEDNGLFVTIGGKSYPFTSYGDKYYNSALFGKKVTAVLNVFGEVCFIDEASPSGTELGLLKSMKVARNDYESTVFYIYSENGEDLELEAAKWIKLDGRANPYNSASIIDMNTVKGILGMVASEYTAVPSPSNKMNIVILYTLNDEGKLSSIDTAFDKEGNPATRAEMAAGDSLIAINITKDDICIKNTYNNIIGKKIIIDKASKVFLYPEDDSVNGYSISVANSVFNNLGTYNAVAYYTDKDSLSPGAYVMSEDDPTYFHTSSSGYMSMILKVTDTVDYEGMPCKKIYMYHNNELVTYFSKPDIRCSCNSSSCGGFEVKDLAPGDIIYAGINKLSNGLEKFYIRFDASANMIYHNDNVTGTTNRKGQRLTVGYPYLTTSKGIHYVDMAESGKDAVSVDISSIDSSSVESMYNQGSFHISDLTSGIPITVFDKNKKGDYVVSPGTADDIMSYLEVQDNCSKMIVHTYAHNSYTLTRGIYIIREANQ